MFSTRPRGEQIDSKNRVTQRITRSWPDVFQVGRRNLADIEILSALQVLDSRKPPEFYGNRYTSSLAPSGAPLKIDTPAPVKLTDVEIIEHVVAKSDRPEPIDATVTILPGPVQNQCQSAFLTSKTSIITMLLLKSYAGQTARKSGAHSCSSILNSLFRYGMGLNSQSAMLFMSCIH